MTRLIECVGVIEDIFLKVVKKVIEDTIVVSWMLEFHPGVL